MKFAAILSLLALLAFRSGGDSITTGLQQQAAEQEKLIAVYFSGSDWCSVCKKFRNETLNVPAIDSLLNNDFIYYTADFPQRQKLEKATAAANDLLAEKLNPGGTFPLLVITDASWNVKSVIRYGNKPEAVIAELSKLRKQ